MPFKATIELLLDVPTVGEACDAVAETLREHTRKFSPNSVIVDWRYQEHPHADFAPVEVGAISSDFNEDSNWPTEI